MREPTDLDKLDYELRKWERNNNALIIIACVLFAVLAVFGVMV